MLGQAISFGIKVPHKELDVTDHKAVRDACERLNPSGLLCLASLDLRRCQENPFDAFQTNTFGVFKVAQEAERRNIPFVMVSTGAIFYGILNDSFTETAIPAPVNLYGQSKWLAEILAAQATPNHLIARTGWLYGTKSTHHLNFVDRALGLAKKGENIIASTDQRGSPTWVEDFVGELKRLISSEAKGVHHVVNDGAATAAEIAQEIIKLTKSSSRLQLVNAADVPNSGPKRSPSEVLISDKVKLRPWREALAAYLKAHL